jgi:hypothetical protein
VKLRKCVKTKKPRPGQIPGRGYMNCVAYGEQVIGRLHVSAAGLIIVPIDIDLDATPLAIAIISIDIEVESLGLFDAVNLQIPAGGIYFQNLFAIFAPRHYQHAE